MNNRQCDVSGDKNFRKVKKKSKRTDDKRGVIYKAVLKKVQEHNDDWIVHIERDDGKSVTAYSYHFDDEYLKNENNWL